MRKIYYSKKRFLFGVVLTLIFLSLFIYIKKNDSVVAEEAVHTLSLTDIPNDTFVVLEIVPNIKYAEFGYLVGGEEPIDIEKAYTNNAFTTTTFGTFKNPLYVEQVDYKMIKEEGCSENPVNHLFSSGYYEKTEPGTGYFDCNIISKDTFGYITNAEFVKNSAGTGTYNFVEAVNTENIKTDYNADFVWVQNQTISVYEKKSLKSSEYFKKLCLKDEDRTVIVKSVTPAELTNDDINRANLVYISPKLHLGSIVSTLWNTYGKNKNYSSSVDSFSNNDLNWEEALLIFKRVAINKNRLPIIMDASLVNGAWDTNVEKLYYMLRKMNPQIFYNLYLNDNTNSEDSTTSDKVTTRINNKGQFLKDNIWYDKWEESWFIQDNNLLNLYGILNNYSVTQDPANVSVSQNIYTYNGDNALPQVFTDMDGSSCVRETDYTKELFQYIRTNDDQNDINSSNNQTSPAIAVRYIIGYQNDNLINNKKAISILDLEPCNDFTKTVEDFRKMMPHFIGTIRITKQTSSSFNGKIEDLNKEYDMIYLGLNCGNSNYTLSSDKLPIYNDANLNGKVYLHVGDRIIGSTDTNINNYPVDWLKDYKNYEECRLPGNDITNLKKKNLQDYLRAGYPIVVDNNLYQVGTSETIRRVDKYSNIYEFIEHPLTDRSTNEVNNLLNLATLNTSNNFLLEKYLEINKPKITMIKEPLAYVGEEVSVKNQSPSLYINGNDPNYRILNYEFDLSDNFINSNQTYTIELYVDRNADGKYAANEKLIRHENCSVGINTISRRLGKEFVGAIPWKLVIMRSDNPAVRTEKIGLSAIQRKSKETIRVLQINSDATGKDVSTLDISNNTLFNEYTSNLNDFSVSFTSITITDFENKYGNAPFKKDDKENTDQLAKNYDMLIIGFANMYPNISNVKGALDNIQYFIDLGKSVLFTHDITSFNNKDCDGIRNTFGYNFNRMFREYFSMDRFGARIDNGDLLNLPAHDKATDPFGGTYHAIHGYTTYALKRIGSKVSKNTLPIYPNMGYSDNQMLTTKVSKLNNGQITSYPYKISDTFTCASTHGQYFQLDLEDDNVVVWYCLAKDGTTDSAYYDKSPNDASNNYYIYNKGNITYSGVGHSAISSDNRMEVKLFVNTMIAAYKASFKEPTVEVVNEDVISKKDGYCLYLDNNENSDTYKQGDEKEIEFVAYENNLLSEDLSCKVILPDGTVTNEVYDSNGNKVTSTIMNKQGENTLLVKSGEPYKIKYDLSSLNEATNKTITIVIENEMGLQGKTTVILLKRSLFDFD